MAQHGKTNYTDGCLLDVKATRDALVGCFENPEDGRYGYWAVNAPNPYFYEWNELKLRFADATHVQYWRNGAGIYRPVGERNVLYPPRCGRRSFRYSV